jgi:undecaprenyl-diphosphatase
LRFLEAWLEPRILAIVVAATSALWAFIEVAEEVVEGQAHAVDSAILAMLGVTGEIVAPLGPPWLQAAARDITALGSFTVLGLVVLAVSVFLVLARKLRTAAFVVVATVSGALASSLLKHLFSRPRPHLFPHGDYVVSASFPSGHAMISALVYLTLGALLARIVPRRRLKLYVMMIALTLTLLIGISRVYLGVHWPTDVLAGWAAGAGWALLWWGLAERVGSRDRQSERSVNQHGR